MKTRLLAALAAAFILAGCGPTYKKATIKESVQKMARKEIGVDVEVREAGRTLGLRFRVPDLAGEISSGDDELYKKMNALFTVLVRVALSSDVPPQFIVLDIVDDQRPLFRLVFTRYVEDIRRSMAEAISYSDSQDRLLEEIVVGNRRVPFDPYEMDLVRLVMMSADAQGAPMPPFVLDEVKFPEFVTKVTENKARRIVRERKESRDILTLRDVRGDFEPGKEATPAPAGNFRLALDLVSPATPATSAKAMESILPIVAKEVQQLFKSYGVGFSNIQVVEKNSGKMFVSPALVN